MITPDQLERPGYDTRDDIKQQRFDAYFNPDSSRDLSGDLVTPTDKSFNLDPETASLFDLFSTRTDFGSDAQTSGFRGLTNRFSSIDTDLERQYAAMFPKEQYLSGRGNNEAEAARYWLAGITDPSATNFLSNESLPRELRQWYFENPDVLGQYVTRWGPGDAQEGGTFQYNPYEFAAAAGAPGLDPNLGKRFQQEQSAEAQASRDTSDFGFGDFLGPIASLASLFVPGLQPLALAYNTYKAIDSGNPLSILGSLGSLGGFTNVLPPGVASTLGNVSRFGNAIQSGNPLGIIQGGLGLANNSGLFSNGSNAMYDDWWSGDTGQGGSSWADFTSTPSGQSDWDFVNGGNFGTDVYGAGGNPLSDFNTWGGGQWGGGDDWGTSGSSGGGGFDLGSVFNSGTLNKGLDFLNKNMNTIGGLAGIYQKYQQGNQMKDMMGKMMGSMDPFGAQRPQYQAQLSQTYTNPALYLNSPEYRAIEDRMRRELERKDAASGRRSQYANRSLDLQQNALANLYKQREQLGGFAGAGIQPQSGMAQAAMAAQGGVNTSRNNMLGDLFRVLQQNQNEKKPNLDLSMFGGGVY